MLFRRKKTEAPQASRSNYRASFRGPETILATIISPSGFAPEGVVADLSIRGAGVLIPFESDPGLAIGDVVELILRSPTNQWTVQTPIRLCGLRQEGPRDLLLGCEFINLGNLYSQLENALGVYFNRRENVRVRPELSQKIIAQVHAGARRIRSPLYDLSTTGMGMVIQGYQRDWVQVGQVVDVRFHLPGVKKELTGPARVRHFDPLSSQLLVGLEFDLDAPKGLSRFSKKLAEYVDRRAVAVDQFESQWSGSDGAPGPPGLEPPRTGTDDW